MIINGQRYDAEPAVEAYVKNLQAENEEQRREILRLTDELKELEQEIAKLDISYYNAALAITRLRAENAQLEELYQKATGVIATDSLPTRAELYKIKLMCKGKACRECAYGEKVEIGYACVINGMPCRWYFGGAENERR